MTRKVDDLQALADFIASKAALFAPADDGHGQLVFRRLATGEQPDLDRRSDLSARHLFQPETHYFLEFEGETGSAPVFRDYEAEERVLFGLRPCDMGGVRVDDRVFAESTSYGRLREATVIVGYLCDRLEPSCFCGAVGLGPRDISSMDVVLFRIADGTLHFDTLTERGTALMEGSPFPISDAVPEPLEEKTPTLPDDLADRLPCADGTLWDEVAFPCVSCRICTYVCPTCHCFTVTDEMFKGGGGRAAVWDSCQSRTFTKEASGHNPRESKTDRTKQRILHKFAYYPSLNDGALMCSGCGRCVTACPTGRHLLEDLLTLAGEVR